MQALRRTILCNTAAQILNCFARLLYLESYLSTEIRLQAYNDIKGHWGMQNNAFVLCIDHVQSDPYASPSRVRIEVNFSEFELVCGFKSNE